MSLDTSRKVKISGNLSYSYNFKTNVSVVDIISSKKMGSEINNPPGRGGGGSNPTEAYKPESEPRVG